MVLLIEFIWVGVLYLPPLCHCIMNILETYCYYYFAVPIVNTTVDSG